MSEQLDNYFIQERSVTIILGILGPLALILAAVGLYGVISYSAMQRLPELGIRMALGASRTNISQLIIREGLILALIGLGIGVSFSMALSRIIANRLHGLNPLDPATYVLISILCLSVAFVAGLLPTFRARLYASNPFRTE
jgi:ABC-type antimicrobial peptide transport system permease subunit